MAPGVLDHPQDACPVIIGKTGLEKGEPRVAKRVIHADQNLAVLTCLLIHQANET